jgi:hypothetical protein
VFIIPTYVAANKLPSSGGICQRTTSTYFIQINNSWFYTRSIYVAHNVKYIDAWNYKIKNC